MNKLKKAKVIRWSIILRSNGEISKLTDCLQNLVGSVSANKTEVILLARDLLENDVRVSLTQHFCEKEGIEYSQISYFSPDVTSEILAKAAEMAKGEFIVFINEDTMASKNFLARLTHAYENFEIDYNIGPVGAVVPVTNNGPGRQLIALPPEIRPEQIDEIQGRIEASMTQNPDNMKWVISGVASDFCMMVSKKVLEEIGPFDMNIKDEVTRGTDFILRLLSKNYYSLICGNVYTYRNCPDVRKGPLIPTDVPAYTEEKLGFLFKVKIDTEQLFEVFLNALKKAAEVGDGIFVLDVGSKIKLGLKIKDREPDLWKTITKYDKVFDDKDDKVSYNKLLEWAEEAGMTWTFSLESGETIEGRATRQYFDRMMHPVNPMVMCYTMDEFYFWDDMTTWRSDGHWGKVNSVRFSRLFPGHRIKGNDLMSSQCGYVAQLPAEVVRPAALRIKCYDLCDEEHRAAVYKRANIVGKGQNWQHLLDADNFMSYPWRNDVTMSVYTPTNTGGEELLEWLDHNWSWTDEMVIGNDCTQLSDADLVTVKNWGGKVVPCIMSEDYGKGRNMIIEKCSKDFIYQMDMDERLTEPMIVFRMLNTDHDAWMFSIDNVQRDGNSIITETARLFRNKDGVRYWGYLHETIDDHLRKSGWKVGLAPVKMKHYGYLVMTPQKAWSKMQRYMRINLKQMKDYPDDSRSYYNLALHLVEDDLVEDAMRLLIASCYLSGGRILPVVELAKLHVQRSLDLFNMVAQSKQGGASSMHVKEYSSQMLEALTKLKPAHQVVAKGHARAFFDTDPTQRVWLFEHLKEIEAKVQKLRTTDTTKENKNKDKADMTGVQLQEDLAKAQQSLDIPNPLDKVKKENHLKLVQS